MKALFLLDLSCKIFRVLSTNVEITSPYFLINTLKYQSFCPMGTSQ